MSTTANRNDPVVVITGASRGIGVSIAHSFAKAGSTLCLIARSAPDLEALAQELVCEYNISVGTWAADISDISRVVSVAQEIEMRHGRVDVLVNNAGIIQFDLVENVDLQNWWRLMEVNLLGPVVLTRSLLPCMLRQGTGTIISIGSRLCGGSAKYLSAYACSKTALMQFHQCLHREVWARGISTFIVQPGNVDTSILTEPGAVNPASLSEDPELARRVQALRDTSTCDPRVTADLCVTLASLPEARILSGLYIDTEEGLDNIFQDISASGKGLIQQHELYQLNIRKLADVEGYAK
ncbi:Dehydrogenase/reductase SDR family member 7B [Penicillium chermesinum]|uniref:Dehydrogenase/reductase SDR family member 7B n=1 Tax=Penicillium chermesinum TaxID=63820 RepID=A0A9W9TXY7_9EURO|nr:Dehydrogenase/reductase SDR family member 7B [Penicillium chermesinum]KAJ5247028.1 Dehydrogenase/reductase SDR family member 7B [Penicillium chermesinum]KAJ6145277.1 Dehydrogenase/reductase SDR family member 7B [Penicillium chermesinum]